MNNTNGAPHEAQFVDDEREKKKKPVDDDEPIAVPTMKELDAAMDRARSVMAPVLEMTFLGVSLYATAKLAWDNAKRKAAKRAREQKK